MRDSQSPNPLTVTEPMSADDDVRDELDPKATLLAQAIVFAALTLSGSALLIATSYTGADSFYPLAGFFAAVYVAWRRFF